MKACLFDLDGCLYAGTRALPDAVEGVNLLVKLGIPCAFLTNNSTDTAEKIREKLLSMGFCVETAPILTPAVYAGEFLRERYGTVSVYLLGGEVLLKSLKEAGHRTDEEEKPDVVLVSRELSTDFRMIQKAVWHLQHGAFFVATNPDEFHPGEKGLRVLETGALVSAIEKVVPQHPVLIGKPSGFLFEKALQVLGTEADQTIIVGDNHFTDIMGGRSAGLKTVLVTSSISRPDLFMEDFKINSLHDLITLFTWEERVG